MPSLRAMVSTQPVATFVYSPGEVCEFVAKSIADQSGAWRVPVTDAKGT